MTQKNIKKIIILGGGTAGWMTAAALGKASKKADYHVQVIESNEISTIGVGESTLTAIKEFNQLIGINENDFIKATQATFKLGIKFVDWNKKNTAYHHAFGQSGHTLGQARFYQYWLKMKMLGNTESYEQYTLNALASEEKKFMRPVDAGNSPLTGIDYGFHLDATLYAQYLQKIAVSFGVERTEGKVTRVKQHINKHIKSLILEDGTEHHADFFIDCSGFTGLLIDKTLKTNFEDWGHWLPCDRAIAASTSKIEEPWSYTQAKAHTAGWQWRIPLQHRVGNGHVYSSKYMSDAEAKEIFLKNITGYLLTEPRVINFKTGYRKQPWKYNCLAIGLSSGFVEPLESTGLHLIQAAIEKLLNMFPTMNFHQEDIDEYNRQSSYKFECIRDFLILHYCTSSRNDSEFWNYCRTMDVPETVVDKINLYKKNGRIFRLHDNMYDVTSWFQVMNGQGLQPKAYDPLVDLFTEEELTQKMKNVADVVRKSADYMPSHQAYIEQHCKASKDGEK
jgi:tryptophan halogenase